MDSSISFHFTSDISFTRYWHASNVKLVLNTINHNEIGLILLKQFERVSNSKQANPIWTMATYKTMHLLQWMFIYQCREVNKQRICLDGGTSLLKKLLCFDRIIFFLTIIDKIYLDPNLIAITFHSKDILKIKHHNHPIISYHF